MVDFSSQGNSAHKFEQELTALNVAPAPYDERALPPQPYMASFPVYADRPRRHRGEIPILVFAVFFGALVFLGVLLYFIFGALDTSSTYSPFHDTDKHYCDESTDQWMSRKIASYAWIILALPALIAFVRGVLYGQMKTNAIEITPHQFPQAYQWLVEISMQFRLKKLPQAFVILGNGTINAFSSGHGYRRFVVIYSDLFEISGQARDPEVVKFVLAHEIGHIAAGHTSWWRIIATASWSQIPFLGALLSRSQEYTADNHGYAYCPHGAGKTMSVLTSGKYLYNHTDPVQLVTRAEQKPGFFGWFANAIQSHPINLWRAHALFFRDHDGALLWRPRKRITHPDAQLSPLYGAQAFPHYTWTSTSPSPAQE